MSKYDGLRIIEIYFELDLWNWYKSYIWFEVDDSSKCLVVML